MKPKYKIGTLVQFEDGADLRYGEVTGVVTLKDGHSYILDHDSPGDAVPEDAIRGAFRPMVTRKSAAKKPRSKKKKAEPESAE